ncbi:branched-chain amino acid transport system II carrier protein [Ignatzschineria ureiclastica]|uniref:Branched-chain amino acid transport system carrier protein n=1 Tax=Ignatzschineria ureiclastica TaxID=472582 RepID=A0A2U2ACW6_9GAMM|nr:branched-chain amino acid transport system II carrier protein [Ignatzschineria ureiclastica]PWD80498.1 branched-chain amino acid transport system II carrier protein [Ignatzschineria ureiclastica]GGZ99027.1 putative branched-chain amino acid carrier protein [Ignatzschineria ureiclastica]
MSRKTLFIGFMLFALFFGAGNLIFPPTVGQLSGSHFVPAIIGFIVTGVGLPLIGIIAGSFSAEGFRSEAKRVHPIFAILFMVVIYLTIGPFFAIPRTAMVSYEMAVLPYLEGGVETFSSKIIFALVYFALTFYLALNPSKLVDRVGKILTPLLLITIILLIVRAFFLLNDPITEVSKPFIGKNAFFIGFSEGYQTMDTIAAVAFSLIVLSAVKATGLVEQKSIFKQAVIAAIIAGVGLGLVYISLAWIGNNYPLTADQLQGGNMGTSILTGVARLTYGEGGRFLLSLIVTLACLTTAIGLIVAVSSYFNELYDKISYKVYAVIFTLISFILASQGLNSIIMGAVPILLIIYPITIVLIILIFIDRLSKGISNLAFQLPIYVTLIISFLSVLLSYMGESSFKSLFDLLPFQDSSMGWMVPAAIALVIGLVFGKRRPRAKTI